MKMLKSVVAIAYIKTKSIGEALEEVRKDIPNADLNMIWNMWEAIDEFSYMQNLDKNRKVD